MTFTELYPNDHHKSFYGKAKIWWNKEGCPVLRSYNTDVCMIDKERNIVRLWDGESATTLRHIRAFVEAFRYSFKQVLNVNMKAWREMKQN